MICSRTSLRLICVIEDYVCTIEAGVITKMDELLSYIDGPVITGQPVFDTAGVSGTLR
jgi:hypothetical protein